MASGSSPQQGDLIENRKDDVRETAASVPAEMEGAIIRKEAEESIGTVYPTVLPTTIYPTIPTIPTVPTVPIGPGPGDLYVAGSGGSGAKPGSAESDVSVRSSVDDLVEVYDRNN